ncbi:Fc.00g082400.m01.CDS01 [Cosmosporella sp. VM-42]
MYPPLKIKQWDPSQPKRKPKPPATPRNYEPRPGLFDGSFAQSVACNAENSSPFIVGGVDLTNADPYAEFPSIQDIINEAIGSAADNSARDSTDTPKPTALSGLRKNEYSPIAIEADEGSMNVSPTQNATPKAPSFPPSLRKREDTCPSTSAGGAFRKPTLISSNVDSDDSDSSLIISVTGSRPRRISRTESPVMRWDNHDGTHSGEPTPLYGNGPCIANVATESPRSAPYCAADPSTPAHRSPAPFLAHFDLNGVLCKGDGIPTSGNRIRHDSIPETPHGRPGHLTPDSSEGQEFGLVDARKPGAVASHTIETETSICSQNASYSLNSGRTSQLPIGTLEAVEVPNNSGDLALSAALSRSTSRARNATSRRHLSPETPQSQGSGSNDIETQAHEATSGLSSGTQEASHPSQEPMMRRRSRRQAAHRLIRYNDDSDSNADGDSQGSEDSDHTNSPRDEDCCSSLTIGEERGQESETSDEGEQCPRKRRRVLKSPTSLMRHAAAIVKRSRQGRTSQRYGARSTKGGQRSQASGILSPASSQATFCETQLGAVLAQFKNWPLENVSLKCITENGRETFQLQLDWSPGHASRADRECVDSPSTQTIGKAKRALSVRTPYTSEEDDLLCKLKEREGLAWPEIHRRFNETYPWRSTQSLQVHYSTKLKSREGP